MTEAMPPTVTARSEEEAKQLRQVTVKSDDEIEAVNQLLADGWRLVTIGQRGEAMVYVLGRSDHKKKARTGFLPGE